MTDTTDPAPQGLFCAIPSRLAVGERFALKVKVLGPVRELAPRAQFHTTKPALHGPFNRNVERAIRYVDDVLPRYEGRLRVSADSGLDGPAEIVFDGVHQGAFPGDTRPIRVLDGYAWREPGLHFLRLEDPATGLVAWSNPVRVTEAPPAHRIAWGDPHWQTFFSDGIRCPEELHAFARDEAFLDFGAVSDHMEAVTDRQWDYFQAVTNDYNDPGRFVTLVGQEWTNHELSVGAPGHRNIYYRGSGGPALRSDDPQCNTLDKLWARLDEMNDVEAIAIPHHTANARMGVDWSKGWNPRYEKAVEIYSVWGCSERPAEAGNPRPIAAENLGGEKAGQHVIDALERGYRFGFVAGGDIHDGRPGDAKHADSYPPRGYRPHDQGFTAVMVPELTREAVFDAIANRQTYATTMSRIYLDVHPEPSDESMQLRLRTAAPDGIAEATVVVNGKDSRRIVPDRDDRVIDTLIDLAPLGSDEFAYIRITTRGGDMAWSTPVWG
ncbi:MAG: DUF3604 domain-containing protein, partial [Planctomycetota bacterium]